VLGMLKQLSRDPVPAVRAQVASRLLALYRTKPDLGWAIVEQFCHEETSRGVLQQLLSAVLAPLSGSDPGRVLGLVKAIYGRVTNGAGAPSVREACVSIFLRTYLREDSEFCRDVLLGMASAPCDSIHESQRILHDVRPFLVCGPVVPPDPMQDSMRKRALDLTQKMLRSTRSAFCKLNTHYGTIPFECWTPHDQERARTLAQLADAIGMEVCFASGALDEQRKVQEPDVREKRRFLEEAGPLLDELAEFGFPALSHYLVETLEYLIPVDPAGVFLRIGRVVRAGQIGGYQYESLAVDRIAALIERYLAEYRVIFQEKEECQLTLLDILDVFVEAGWPKARRLAYRLEEIFR